MRTGTVKPNNATPRYPKSSRCTDPNDSIKKGSKSAPTGSVAIAPNTIFLLKRGKSRMIGKTNNAGKDFQEIANANITADEIVRWDRNKITADARVNRIGRESNCPCRQVMMMDTGFSA